MSEKKKSPIKRPELKLTDKERDDLLHQVFEKDYAVTVVKLSEDAPPVTLKTVDYASQEILETKLSKLSKSNDTGRKVLQEYALTLLSYTLVSWGEVEFDDPANTEKFLRKKPVAILDKFVKEQQTLERKVRQALGTENIEDTFFPKDELPEESEQSPAESIPESADHSGKQ